MSWLARHRSSLGMLAVVALLLVLVAVARPTVGWDPNEEPTVTSTPGPEPKSRSKPAEAETENTGKSEKSERSEASGQSGRPEGRPDPATFGTRPIRHASEVEAELVDVTANAGNGWESVTFRFAHGTKLPHYTLAFTDAVRLYPDEDPIPVRGNAFLTVGFERTDPNQANRLAFPPSLSVGQPQIAEVLLYDNLSQRLRFAIGLDERTRFRVRTPHDPLRLVVQIETPR